MAKTAKTSAQAPVQSPASTSRVVTLSNASDAKEVLTAIIAIMKSKVHITSADMDLTRIFRVLSDGNAVTRDNGQSVILYNTNATTPQLIAGAHGMIDVAEFLAFDLESAKEAGKKILNACSLSIAVDPSVAIFKNDEIKAKPVAFTTKAGVDAVGLNFVGIQRAEVAKKGNTSALDALLASFS